MTNEELDEEARDIEDRTSKLPIAAKHVIMVQYYNSKKIDYETYADVDYVSAALARTVELEEDPTVRYYVVILTIVAAGIEIEEIMMVRDLQRNREYKDQLN